MAEYLRYVIRNTEPVRIADESTSQSGQTNTLCYIPGTTIRGLVISELAKDERFESWKKQLFGNEVAYLNAYPMAGEQELFPSPKGFYEDKTVAEGKKDIQNVVCNGKFEEGYKRAGLGKYSYLDRDCVCYYSVDTGADLKVRIHASKQEERTLFRNEHIMPGQLFCGYIKVNNPELKKQIAAVFRGQVIIGSSRSAGLGKCEVLHCEEVSRVPYGEYLPEKEEGHCYMLLLSNTAMRKGNGELCGIDVVQLQEKMGVQNLEVEFCSTSTVTVQGYNSTWKTRVPSAVMFEQGSVFKLKFTGNLTKETMERLCHDGIGIRRNEGCGRIVFLRDYEAVRYKLAGKAAEQSETLAGTRHKEDEEMLRRIAKQIYLERIENAVEQYIVEERSFRKGTISKSQLGNLEAMATAFRYNPEEAVSYIEAHLKHSMKREKNRNIQKNRGSYAALNEFTEKLFSEPLEIILQEYLLVSEGRIMGIETKTLLTKEEEISRKLQMITELIRYDNKKESR